MNTAPRNEGLEKVASLIKDIRIAFLTTAASDGTLHARPMATHHDAFDGTLRFITNIDSAKVKEANRDDRVSLTYAEPKSSTYVALSGTASTQRDPALAKQMWNPFVQAWFPNGPDDPQVAILTVTVDRAEYWDAPSLKFVQLFQIAKANLTGQPPAMGDHGVVTM